MAENNLVCPKCTKQFNRRKNYKITRAGTNDRYCPECNVVLVGHFELLAQVRLERIQYLEKELEEKNDPLASKPLAYHV